MVKYFIYVIIMLFVNTSFAEDQIPIALSKAKIDIHDVKSIERGAKMFATTCMSCHTMIYMRYNKLAQEAGVVYEKMPLNIKNWPLGVKPPDLSLEVSRRGVDWVYTYLHSFYLEPSRPMGVNNLLFPNTAMAAILMPYQGQLVRVNQGAISKIYSKEYQWYDLLVLKTPGSMTPEQFDELTRDVVNFLAYASEPYKVEQERLGKWVIGFLLILFILVYLLKKEYWKDIKREE